MVTIKIWDDSEDYGVNMHGTLISWEFLSQLHVLPHRSFMKSS